MTKIMFTLVTFFVIALALSGLRRERLAVTSQTAALNARIWRKRHRLWSQEAQIAARTNPVTLARQLSQDDLPDHDPGDVGGVTSKQSRSALDASTPTMPDFLRTPKRSRSGQ